MNRSRTPFRRSSFSTPSSMSWVLAVKISLHFFFPLMPQAST